MTKNREPEEGMYICERPHCFGPCYMLKPHCLLGGAGVIRKMTREEVAALGA